MVEYPLYPYQERKLYKRLKDAFPISGLMTQIVNRLAKENLSQYKNFLIEVEVKNLGKDEEGARKDVINYERYVEEGFPDFWIKPKKIEPKYLGFEIRPIDRHPVYTDYRYKLQIEPSTSSVLVEEKRRMVQYSRRYVLSLEVLKDQFDWLSKFVNSFFYCPQIHELDFINVSIKALTPAKEERTIFEPSPITKSPFQMPILNSLDYLFMLKKFFSYEPVREFIADQIKGRYGFAWKLAPVGEPIPRRHGIDFESADGIQQAFERERCVEFYRSADKRETSLVDLLIREYDPPLLVDDRAKIWKTILEDEQHDLELLFTYGVKPNSVEENYSGHKSLQMIIHVNPPVTYVEQRDFQKFLATYHKFVVAKDSFMYTLHKNGLSRVTKTLPDFSYGAKKEIKTVPTPNIKREAVHCSVPLNFSYDSGIVRFPAEVYDWNIVSKKTSFCDNVLERFRVELETSAPLSMEERVFKPQYYFEKNATHPDVFRKLMQENNWLVKAIGEIDPYILDLYRTEWIKEKFA